MVLTTLVPPVAASALSRKNDEAVDGPRRPVRAYVADAAASPQASASSTDHGTRGPSPVGNRAGSRRSTQTTTTAVNTSTSTRVSATSGAPAVTNRAAISTPTNPSAATAARDRKSTRLNSSH